MSNRRIKEAEGDIPVGKSASIPLGRRTAPDLPTTPSRRAGDLPTAGLDFVSLAQKGGGWFSFITPIGYFIVTQTGSDQDPRFDISFYDVSERKMSSGISSEELLKYQDSIQDYTVVTTALGPPKQPDTTAVKRSLPNKGAWGKLKNIFTGLFSAGKKEHIEHLKECIINSGVKLIEERKMNSSDIVKKDLLRRKIREHFSKHPRAKSVVVKADIGDRKTIWRAQKMASGVFSVVEVNTVREQFLITEISGQASPEYQQLSTSIVSALASGNPAEKERALNDLEMTMPRLRPQEKGEAEKLRAMLGTGGASTAARDSSASFRASSSIPGLGSRPASPSLRANKQVRGRKVAEADEPEKKEKPKKKKKSDMPTATPHPDAQPPGAEMAATTTPTGDTEPVDKPETDLDVTFPNGAEMQGKAPSPDQDPGVKTAEEERLKKMVMNKPIQDISVSSDSDRGTIVLTLGGLKNPVEISVFDSGKVTYKLGSLSQLLKPSA